MKAANSKGMEKVPVYLVYLVNNIFYRNFNFLELDDSPASCITHRGTRSSTNPTSAGGQPSGGVVGLSMGGLMVDPSKW